MFENDPMLWFVKKPNEKFQRCVIILLWEVIYIHFYNWDRPLDLVLVVYNLIELIIEVSLWTKDYFTFDTHTQHIRLMFNKCLFHLCDCTWSNVMCLLNCLSIIPKKIFEYFICFLKWFYAFMFLSFCVNCIFNVFHQKLLQGDFREKLPSHKNELWQNSENTKFRQRLSRLKASCKKLCASYAFFTNNFASM